MTEINIHFDNSPSGAGRVEADKPAPEAESISAEVYQLPPDDILRLASEGLKMVARVHPNFEPSAHISAGNWYGHKKIKPTGRQLHELG
jgi:hypothetical protein